ncbi:MAG: elongation factor G [Clostridia bacterium]
MADYKKEQIRNIALIGHGGEGKTSLFEAILFKSNVINRLGKVSDGTTTSDYDSEEIARKMSINMSLGNIDYKGTKINIIDVPGFFDFEGEMVAALNVVDGAVIVTQASGSMSVGTEKAIDMCTEMKIPMIIFINGINKENSSYAKAVAAIKAKYGNKVLAIDYPIMDGYTMKGHVDICAKKAFDNDGNEIDIPADLASMVDISCVEIDENAAGASEELLESFVVEEKLSREDRVRGIKMLSINGEFIPVIPGVVIGEQPALADLLDLVVELMPRPQEVNKMKATIDEKEEEIICDENGKFACRVFKTIIDPFVGKLLLFKVYSGSVKVGDSVYNVRKSEIEKVSALYFLNGKQQTQASEVFAGDIGAFAKFNYSKTNDTLCDPNYIVNFPLIDFPKPIFTLAIIADEKGGSDKVIDGLKKFRAEDPTFYVGKDIETGETVVRGLGETQIDVLMKKVKNKYKVEAQLKAPRVAYRETIRKVVEQQGKCKKQNGGSGLFGDVHIRFEPAPDVDFEFISEVVGGAVPKQYFPSVEKGLREVKDLGILAGYPMVNFRATLFFGSYHPVDSKEAAFIEAAKIAFKEGIPKAEPVLLEPIGNVKVTIPTEFMGDIMGDLTKRRGKVFGMDTKKGKTIISGEAPQSEMTRYAIDLRSMTQGRGRYEIEFARYEDVPQNLSSKIIEDAKNS